MTRIMQRAVYDCRARSKISSVFGLWSTLITITITGSMRETATNWVIASGAVGAA